MNLYAGNRINTCRSHSPFSLGPTGIVSESPSLTPSVGPSIFRSQSPSIFPSQSPSISRSLNPTSQPNQTPSSDTPTSSPSEFISTFPSTFPVIDVIPPSERLVTVEIDPILLSLRFAAARRKRYLIEFDYSEIASLTETYVEQEWPEAEADLNSAFVLSESQGVFTFVTIAIRGSVTYAAERNGLTEMDVQNRVESLFENDASRKYSDLLKTADDPVLASVLGVNPGLPVNDFTENSEDDKDDGVDTILIAVISGCGAVVLAVFCFIGWLFVSKEDSTRLPETAQLNAISIAKDPELQAPDLPENVSEPEDRADANQSEVTSVYSYINDQSTLGEAYAGNDGDDDRSFFSKLWSAGDINAKSSLAPAVEENSNGEDSSSKDEKSYISALSLKSGRAQKSSKTHVNSGGVSRILAEVDKKKSSSNDVLEDPSSFQDDSFIDNEDDSRYAGSPMRIRSIASGTASVSSAVSHETGTSRDSRGSKSSRTSRGFIKNIFGGSATNSNQVLGSDDEDNMKYLDNLIKHRPERPPTKEVDKPANAPDLDCNNSFDSSEQSILTM